MPLSKPFKQPAYWRHRAEQVLLLAKKLDAERSIALRRLAEEYEGRAEKAELQLARSRAERPEAS
jgi:hypothetical protein